MATVMEDNAVPAVRRAGLSRLASRSDEMTDGSPTVRHAAAAILGPSAADGNGPLICPIPLSALRLGTAGEKGGVGGGGTRVSAGVKKKPVSGGNGGALIYGFKIDGCVLVDRPGPQERRRLISINHSAPPPPPPPTCK